jgi:hypothetical protein
MPWAFNRHLLPRRGHPVRRPFGRCRIPSRHRPRATQYAGLAPVDGCSWPLRFTAINGWYGLESPLALALLLAFFAQAVATSHEVCSHSRGKATLAAWTRVGLLGGATVLARLDAVLPVGPMLATLALSTRSVTVGARVLGYFPWLYGHPMPVSGAIKSSFPHSTRPCHNRPALTPHPARRRPLCILSVASLSASASVPLKNVRSPLPCSSSPSAAGRIDSYLDRRNVDYVAVVGRDVKAAGASFDLHLAGKIYGGESTLRLGPVQDPPCNRVLRPKVQPSRFGRCSRSSAASPGRGHARGSPHGSPARDGLCVRAQRPSRRQPQSQSARAESPRSDPVIGPERT